MSNTLDVAKGLCSELINNLVFFTIPMSEGMEPAVYLGGLR